MEIVFSPEAVEEIRSLPEDVRQKIMSGIEELKNNPTNHADAKLVQIDGKQVYRLKISEGRGEDLDHRAVFDIEDGKIRVYSVFHRDKGYDKDEIGERI
ncbi:MAG: type II toxin-antitoxin system RelE/ParE family toxin [Candidatus Nanohaloarchaea archaeon]